MNLYGARRLLAAFLRDRAGGALLIVLFLLMVVVEFGAAVERFLAVVRSEHGGQTPAEAVRATT